MFVSSLSVKVGGDGAVIERYTDVQKGYRCERIIGCKFNSGVNVIDRSSERQFGGRRESVSIS